MVQVLAWGTLCSLDVGGRLVQCQGEATDFLTQAPSSDCVLGVNVFESLIPLHQARQPQQEAGTNCVIVEMGQFDGQRTQYVQLRFGTCRCDEDPAGLRGGEVSDDHADVEGVIQDH